MNPRPRLLSAILTLEIGGDPDRLALAPASTVIPLPSRPTTNTLWSDRGVEAGPSCSGTQRSAAPPGSDEPRGITPTMV